LLSSHVKYEKCTCFCGFIDPFHKWLPSINSFVNIKISLTNLIFELVIQKNFYSQTSNHIINPVLTSLFVQEGLILASIFFFVCVDLNSILVHKHGKKELGQYPAILTSRLVNNPVHVYSILACLRLYHFSLLQDRDTCILKSNRRNSLK